MLKKVIILLSICSPFIIYFILDYFLKFKKNFPLVKLAIISVVFLSISLTYFRYISHNNPNLKYIPPSYKDGKLNPAQNK